MPCIWNKASLGEHVITSPYAEDYDRTVESVVREYLPFISEDDAGFIVWNCTGWPAFFDGDPATSIRQALWNLTMGLVDGTGE